MHINVINTAIIGFTCVLANPLAGATLTLQGNGLSTLGDAAGTPLTDGSIVQVGYFLGVDTSLSPKEYTQANWESFVAFTGANTDNSRIDIRTRTQGAFRSVYTLGTLEFDDSTGDRLPPLPARFGIRIFDTIDSAGISNANYNTVSSSSNTWFTSGVATDPPTPDPILGFAQGGASANPALAWQDNANPFNTSIAVPEPSTSLSALLGLGLLIGVRRRK